MQLKTGVESVLVVFIVTHSGVHISKRITLLMEVQRFDHISVNFEMTAVVSHQVGKTLTNKRLLIK